MRPRPLLRSFGLLVLGLAVAPLASADAASSVSVENPRAFGHFIGDRLERHIELTVPYGYGVAEDGLPKPGRVTPWFALTAATAQSTPGFAGVHYRIALTYLAVNSPMQAKVVELPTVRLKFSAAGKAFEEKVEAWPISLAPLTTSINRLGLEEMRPDRAPKLIDTTMAQTRLALCVTLAAATLLFLLFAQFVWPWLKHRNGPFATAHRRLQSLAKDPPSAANFQAALRTLHRAFDETAGVRVFPEQLDQFLSRHPQFSDLRGSSQRFFAASSGEFFDKGVDAEVRRLDWLLHLSSDYRARERRA
jgi:mxaA protein